MSDTMARISEVAALQCGDVEPDTITGGGTVHIRASKTDQRGDGFTRYIGPAALAAVGRYLAAAGHTTGPLFRRVLSGARSSTEALKADSIPVIVRRRIAAVADIPGRIGGWRSAATLEIYIRREGAVRGPVARHRHGVGRRG